MASYPLSEKGALAVAMLKELETAFDKLDRFTKELVIAFKTKTRISSAQFEMLESAFNVFKFRNGGGEDTGGTSNVISLI